MLACFARGVVVIPRRLRRYRILFVPSFIKFTWVGMFILAVYTNLMGWFAAKDLGDARWVQFPLIQPGFTVGFIADDLWSHWRDGIAHALHFEDVLDGTCPDTEREICEAAVWRWYEKQGRTWWVSPYRDRTAGALCRCVAAYGSLPAGNEG